MSALHISRTHTSRIDSTHSEGMPTMICRCPITCRHAPCTSQDSHFKRCTRAGPAVFSNPAPCGKRCAAGGRVGGPSARGRSPPSSSSEHGQLPPPSSPSEHVQLPAVSAVMGREPLSFSTHACPSGLSCGSIQLRWASTNVRPHLCPLPPNDLPQRSPHPRCQERWCLFTREPSRSARPTRPARQRTRATPGLKRRPPGLKSQPLLSRVVPSPVSSVRGHSGGGAAATRLRAPRPYQIPAGLTGGREPRARSENGGHNTGEGRAESSLDRDAEVPARIVE